MLTLHGKAYHMIFDLQQQYEDMNFRIVAEFIYPTVSSPKSVLLKLNADIADTLRTHIHENVQ